MTSDECHVTPEDATPRTVADEWWTSTQLSRHLGYRNTRDVNTWFRRHLAAGHFDHYEAPRRAIVVNHTDGADPRGNRWEYWAPACVEVHARSVARSSRLRDLSELE